MAIIDIDRDNSNSAAVILRGKHPLIIPGTEGVNLGGNTFPGAAWH